MGIDVGGSSPHLNPVSAELPAYSVRLLDGSTWDAFAELVARNGGVFGGCASTGLWVPES